MQLHANAALSLIKRRQMVRRVVEDGWNDQRCRRGCGHLDQDRWEVAGSLPGARRDAAVGPQFGAGRSPQPHERRARKRDKVSDLVPPSALFF